jgi:25S rRNA (uracil2843-N3)-methyltransferase
MDKEALIELLGSEPLTVTLMFTLNELYTNGGIGKTTKFLKLLGEILPDRSLLLVVDSPGSYSEAAVGKEKKRYPMQWLLDHTLTDIRAASKDYEWEQLESHDSIWFRLPEELSYPIQLENMRYQMHLYQRKSMSTAA